MKNAHEFPHIYKRWGVDLRDLGCLMLNTESPVWEMYEAVPYVSPDPKKFWIKGLLDHWHVTVRYGFLSGITANDVDDVLADVELPSTLKISGLDVFPSPYEDEEYDCLVARVDDEALTAMNTALSVLPNINTFPEYKAHITIGYFEKNSWQPPLLKSSVKTLDLDYGHNLPRS